MNSTLANLDAVLFDLDGTVYRGEELVPGADVFIARLHEAGVVVRYVTNKSDRLPEEVAEHLTRIGVPASSGHIYTSSVVTAGLLVEQFSSDSRIFVVGAEGVRRPLEEVGYRLTQDVESDFSAIVIGFDPCLSYELLREVVLAVGKGVPFYATNPDEVIRTERGLEPENGAILAAVRAATKRSPTIVGKPQPLMLECALKECGVPPHRALMIGDNPKTDIAAAHAANMRSVLLSTGVPHADSSFQPTWSVRDYYELSELLC